MPGHELKRNLPRLSSLFKSLPGKAAAMQRSPRWHRSAAWAVGSLLLLWVLAYALVPVVLKSQLEKMASQKLGRQLTVGAVDFRPWSLELTLSDLAIAKAGNPSAPVAGPENTPLSPGAPQIKIARLYIDAEMQSLLRLAPVADAIEVDGLTLSLTHLGQGRYDVDDILARLKPPADEPASSPLRFALCILVLSDGQHGRGRQRHARTGRAARRGAQGLPRYKWYCARQALLGAPKSVPSDAKWTPRAELNLAMP